MYNVNYGDGRNYPSWPPETQQQKPPQQQSPTLPQKQQPSAPSQHFQSTHDISTPPRLWVDVPNDEVTMHQIPLFKNSKSHLTPPLDLSEGRRQVESPLDLSVKTRKRCADTTDYGEAVGRQSLSHTEAQMARQSLSHTEAQMAKRQCLTQDYAYPLGHPNCRIEHVERKYVTAESVSRGKPIQQKQMSIGGKYPSGMMKQVSATSPSTLAQKQYEMQRQQLVNKSRSLPMTQKETSNQYPGAQASHVMHPVLQKTHSMFEPDHLVVKKTQHSNMTESVALKDFFEPTHKVTVQTNIPQQTIAGPRQQVYSSGPTDQHIAVGSSRPRSGSELSDFEDSRRPQTFPSNHLYQPRVPSSGNAGFVSVSEIERFHHYQRQMQSQKTQRDQIAMLSQLNPQKNIMLPTSEQQKLAYAIERQKQVERSGAHMSTTMQGGYTAKAQHSPYTVVRHPTATAPGPDGLSARKDRHDFAAARCIRVGQPVPLGDIQHDHALEQVLAIRNRPELYTQHELPESYKSKAANIELLHPNPPVFSTSPGMPTSLGRYEHDARAGGSREIHDRTYYMTRNEQSGSSELSVHPSVIQRPPGFIPPRIVKRSGLPGEMTPQRRSSESSGDVQRFEKNYEQSQRYRNELVEREKDRVQHPHKYSDMLSGKEVMKIQQRVAEQRGEINTTGLSNNRSYARQINVRENEPVFLREQSNSALKAPGRRKSLTEMVSRESRISEQNYCVSRDVTKQFESLNNVQRRTSAINESQHEIRGETKTLISAPTFPSERSITKGTSGLKTKPVDMDPFSRFVRRELQRTDDVSVNPFANRSILQEFDRSANSSPVRKPSEAAQAVQLDIPSVSGADKTVFEESAIVSSKHDPSYTLPLQIAIPGHKVTMSSSVSTISTASAIRNTAVASKLDIDAGKQHPKLMSRKHMILHAFRQEEDLKNTASSVNIDKDEKVPMVSAKFAAKRSDREAYQHGHPASPKMPILSPQERNRVTPMVSPAIGDPPSLESSSSTNVNNNNNESSKKEIHSLEEHLHRLISDAVKGSISQDKDSVYESFQRKCRELTSQPPGNKVFLTRQLSQTRNIPVANVAPIIHGKTLPDTVVKDKPDDLPKLEDTDEEDAKMADIVTRSLWGDLTRAHKTSAAGTDHVSENNDMTKTDDSSDKSNENALTLAGSTDNIFDQNNTSCRMSPGLKKLMLYRHRDGAVNSKSTSANNENIEKPDFKPFPEKCEESVDVDADKSVSSARNVFGVFKDIVSRRSSSEIFSEEVVGAEVKFSKDTVTTKLEDVSGTGWTGYQTNDDADVEGHEIQMVLNTDYDGDDEQVREKLSTKRSKLSITKQQADRLIKRARHRRNSKQDGDVRSRHILRRARARSQKGFVDFIPQVLPRRTRSKCTGSSQHRRHSKSGSPTHSSSNEPKAHLSPQKTRQRRASSLDRETKSGRSRVKSRSSCHSDNEVDSEKKDGGDSDATWRNEDESTDEDYFQNYEDEFKHFLRKSEGGLYFKKSSTANANKKKKGFHFKQKYIFQRKRKANRGRGRGLDPHLRFGGRLDSIYNFHEESPDPSGTQQLLGELYPPSNIPVPPDLKRVTVGKESGQTMLHRAARMGLEDVVLYCLAIGSVDVNARDNAGYTALHECALRGRVKIGKHLLTHGADVNCCSTDGIRPIHDAVENDHIEMLRLLLSYGADPTLSTYAGRSLAKIARTERMLKFIQRYNGDINGYANEKEEKKWLFKTSCSRSPETQSGVGCAIFEGLPSDPEDESQDACTLSSKPLFTTRRITLEPNKRVEDFLMLDEIFDSFRVNRSEFLSQGTSSSIRHLIKQLPIHSLIDAHKDSIYYEDFSYKDSSAVVDVIRKVDSTQLIAKLEKCISDCPQRTKV